MHTIATLSVDAQASFGFARRWDVIVDLRFGVEADFSQSHQFAVAPGVRYWMDADRPAKFFATIQGVYDLRRRIGEPSVVMAGRQTANVYAFVFAVTLHPQAVAEQRPAGNRAGWIDCNDTNSFLLDAQALDQQVNQ